MCNDLLKRLVGLKSLILNMRFQLPLMVRFPPILTLTTLTVSFDIDQPLPSHLQSPLRTTLRYLLKNELDIESVPRVSFFEWLAGFSEGDMQEKLRWFCSGEGQVSTIHFRFV